MVAETKISLPSLEVFKIGDICFTKSISNIISASSNTKYSNSANDNPPRSINSFILLGVPIAISI